MGRLGKFAIATVAALVVVGGLAIPQAAPAPIAYSPTPIAGWSTNGIVKAVLIIGDTAYAGGAFTQVQGPGGAPTLVRSNLAAFDIHTGAIRAGFTGGTNGRVESMATDGTHLFIGGDFTTVNNLNKVRLASLDPSTGNVNNGFTAGATSHVYALRVKGSRLYVGGSFSTLGNVARGRIGAVDTTTGAVDPTFNPGADDAVHAIVTSPDGNTVYVGGDFLNIGGGPRGWLAPLSAVTGQLLPLVFQYPIVTGSIPSVWDLDISPAGDRVFGALGGYENRVSSWSTTTGQNQWFYQVDGDTQAVKYSAGNAYFGFHEGALDDHTIRMRAADSATGQIDNFYTPMDSFFGVWDIDANAEALVVGGEFTNFNGVATQGIAILPKASSDTVPPGPPSNLTITGSAATSISMSWGTGSDNNAVAGYRVLRNGVEVAYPTGLTYTDTDLTPQTSYTYAVQTVDAAGNFSTSSNVVVGSTGVVLTPAGSVWKYLDNGTNQGTAWRAPAFNDTTWASGPAQLGYGDGDEATVVGFGPDPNHKYTTTYFRRQFTVANPATVGGLTLRLLRDDGAVVYLNGTEVVRSNMPAGTITSTTNAVTSIEGADEIAWNVFNVNPALLTAGTNTLAVEIHQQWAGSSDISFDLALESAGVSGGAPAVTLQAPANNSFVKTASTTFSGACSNGAGNVTVNVTGTSSATFTAPCTASQWSVNGALGDGTYSAAASQTLASLTGTSNTVNFVVDTTAPVVTVTQPANGATVSPGTVNFSGQCSAGDGAVAVAITGASSANLSTACTAGAWTSSTALAGGAFSVTASQTDAAGNTGTSVANSFIVNLVDPDPPVTTDNTASIGNGWRNTTTTVTLSPTDTGSGVAATYYTTDGSTPTTSSSQGTSAVLSAAGTYTIKYFSVDNVGNTEAVKTAGTQIRIDKTAPSTTDNTASIGNAWRTTATIVALSPTDTGGSGVATTYYTTDGSTPTVSSAQGTSIGLAADGTYTIKYFSVDAAGNAEPVQTASSQIRIDSGAPVTTDNTASFGSAWRKTTTSVTLSPTDAGSGVAATYYTTDGSTPTTSSSQGTSVVLSAEGTYTIKYFSVDNLGNTEAVKTAGTQIRIDKTAPSTTDNTASIGNAWRTTATIVALSPTDTGGSGVATTYYTTDGSTPTVSSSQGTSIGLAADGTYTIKYFSVDAAGNAETVKTAGTQIRIDSGAPVTTDNTASIGSAWRNTPATVTLNPTDPGSGVAATYYTTDGSTPTTVSASGTSVLLTADGTYTIKYFSVDNLGNTEAVKTAGTQIRIDTVAPVVTLTQPADGDALTAASVTFSGSCSSGDGTVGVAITGTASASASAPCNAGSWSTSKALASGAYSATASQTDAAGNTGASSTNGFTVTAPDSDPPVTTDNTASIGNAWLTTATVTLSATDPGSGVATTYYTTDGSTPTTSSSQGTSIGLSANGTYTIKYFSVDTLGNTEAVKTAGTQIRIDTVAPVTTDNTASIGNAWRSTPATVTLSRSDAGSGVAATYYTTDGSTPTVSSSQGTSIVLSAGGTYTVKYFSVDNLGNTETVKTAGTQIRIDTVGPTAAFTFPVSGSVFNAARWNAGCATARICGTAADASSGVASVGLTIQRSSDSRFWNGSTWQVASSTRPATGTTSWFLGLATSALTNGVTYTVTARSTDAAGNQSAPVVTTFTYDTSAPATSTAAVTNHNGAVETTVDTFTVTFGEALDPATVPSTATLTLSRSNGNTSYGISGITNGLLTTGTTGYITSAGSTRTVTYAGSVVLTNSNRTVTFTVTGTCSGSCGAVSSTVRTGRFVFTPATTLLDRAGNAATGSITSSTQAMF